MIGYDTIAEFNMDSKADSSAYLARVARKKYKKKMKLKVKQTNASVHLVQYRLKFLWRQSGRNQSDYGGNDLRKRWVLSLEWKVEGVVDGESEGGDCDEVICARWGEPGEWTQWGWRNEEGSWFHRWGDAYLKEQLVICNDEDTDGRVRVTTDEERVLPED